IFKWLPLSMDNCIALGRLLKIYGYDLGYQKFLDGYPTHVNGFPAAKRLLVQIQDIYYLRKAFPDGQLFSIALAGIVMDRDYPYDIEETEEEMP
ncbi:MAG: hypothetical protein KKH61_20560, partial [Gammaproteobacteria bacterium]|nr:hypothetical protein [Gammaproteobacteria bacterium]